MKFSKEEKEKIHTFSMRMKNTMREDIQKIADREKVSPGLIVRTAVNMLLEQDRKDQKNEQYPG